MEEEDGPFRNANTEEEELSERDEALAAGIAAEGPTAIQASALLSQSLQLVSAFIS